MWKRAPKRPISFSLPSSVELRGEVTHDLDVYRDQLISALSVPPTCEQVERFIGDNGAKRCASILPSAERIERIGIVGAPCVFETDVVRILDASRFIIAELLERSDGCVEHFEEHLLVFIGQLAELVDDYITFRLVDSTHVRGRHEVVASDAVQFGTHFGDCRRDRNRDTCVFIPRVASSISLAIPCRVTGFENIFVSHREDGALMFPEDRFTSRPWRTAHIVPAVVADCCPHHLVGDDLVGGQLADWVQCPFGTGFNNPTANGFVVVGFEIPTNAMIARMRAAIRPSFIFCMESSIFAVFGCTFRANERPSRVLVEKDTSAPANTLNPSAISASGAK